MNFSFLAQKGDYDVAKQLSVIVEGVRPFGIQAEKSGRNDIKIGGRKFPETLSIGTAVSVTTMAPFSLRRT